MKQVKEKCLAKNCRHKDTVDTNNLGKYGVCAKCNGFEHFNCVNVSEWIKDNVNDGFIKYYCKICLSKHPELGFQKSLENAVPLALEKQSENAVNIPQDGTSATIEVEDIEVHGTVNIDIERLKCNECEFDTQCKEIMESHRKAKHIQVQSYNFKECDYENVDEKNLRKHTEESHNNDEVYECNSCDFWSNNKDIIPNHIKEKHL